MSYLTPFGSIAIPIYGGVSLASIFLFCLKSNFFWVTPLILVGFILIAWVEYEVNDYALTKEIPKLPDVKLFYHLEKLKQEDWFFILSLPAIITSLIAASEILYYRN